MEKLTFEWPQGGQSFSFDLGGKLRYGDFDGKLFYAEVKKYSKSLDLAVKFADGWRASGGAIWRYLG